MSELEDALADFAACRSARIADAIDAIGRAAAVDFALPKITKNIEYHRAWLAGIADPATRSWFLDKVLEKLPKLVDGKEHSSGDKSTAVAERFAALAQLPCDPRIGRAVLATAALRSPVCGFEDATLAMREALLAHADDAAAASPALEELTWVEEDDQVIALELPKPAKGKQIERWSKRAAPTKQKLDATALFAAVYADPDSDAPREVLADALQSAGDPRGEFIALQLREARGDASEALVERATELCKEHGKDWLGAQRVITYRADLRRGFLARLELAGAWATKDWKQVCADPALRTIERLEAGQATGKIYAQVLAAVAPTVQDIEIFDDAMFELVRRTPMPRLRAVRVRLWKRKPYEQRFVEGIVPWLEAQPAITTLECANASDLEALSEPCAARLRQVFVRDDLDEVAPLWKALPKLLSLMLGFTTKLELVRDGKHERACIYPDKFGWGSSLDLKQLPKSITDIIVIGNAKAAKELAAKFPKLNIAIAQPPSGYVTGVK